MVQHSFPVSFIKKLSHQPVNSQETAYRAATFLSAQTKKRRVNTIANKIIKNHPLRNESSPKVFVRRSDLARKQAGKRPGINWRDDERADGPEKNLQPPRLVPAANRIKPSELGPTDSGNRASHVPETSLRDLQDTHFKRFRRRLQSRLRVNHRRHPVPVQQVHNHRRQRTFL